MAKKKDIIETLSAIGKIYDKYNKTGNVYTAPKKEKK